MIRYLFCVTMSMVCFYFRIKVQKHIRYTSVFIRIFFLSINFLQEVDHFNFLNQVLKTQGYAGMFFPKPDSPCLYINGNNGPDGCAIFYRQNKFDLLKKESRILELWRVQSNQVRICDIFIFKCEIKFDKSLRSFPKKRKQCTELFLTYVF